MLIVTKGYWERKTVSSRRQESNTQQGWRFFHLEKIYWKNTRKFWWFTGFQHLSGSFFGFGNLQNILYSFSCLTICKFQCPIVKWQPALCWTEEALFSSLVMIFCTDSSFHHFNGSLSFCETLSYWSTHLFLYVLMMKNIESLFLSCLY